MKKYKNRNGIKLKALYWAIVQASAPWLTVFFMISGVAIKIVNTGKISENLSLGYVICTSFFVILAMLFTCIFYIDEVKNGGNVYEL